MKAHVTVIIGLMDRTWYTEKVELIEPYESDIVSSAIEYVEKRIRMDEKAAKKVSFLAVWHIDKVGTAEAVGESK